MKRLGICICSLVLLLFGTANNISGQLASTSATGEIFAEVISVFSATQTSQLNFGKFSPGPQGGEIILTPEGSVLTLGSIFKGPGTPNAGSFYVSGDIDAAYSISLPEEPVVITNTYSEKSMLVENWVSVPLAGTGTGLLQNGSQTVYIGATLKVGTMEENPVGMYTGSYTVTFDFN
ncbi:MAG: DUF4402 domain-containing protein [Bacteroidales bacterium]|nr:DUF4402 domain-containing protein [Bacteroidales bacterium]